MMVGEIMGPARWTIGPDDSLGPAERIMAHRRVHQLLVVDAGALVGLLSERDVLDYRPGVRGSRRVRGTVAGDSLDPPTSRGRRS